MIPVLTTSAGSCLTAKNWLEARVKTVSFHLDSLLIRPGYQLLENLGSLAAYAGWQGQVVLNAALVPDKKNKEYTVRSPVDGKLVSLSLKDILALVLRLEPDMVVLPHGAFLANDLVWQWLPEATFPFFPKNDVLEDSKIKENKAYGIYHDALNLPNDNHSDRACYVVGDFDLSTLEKLNSLGVQYIESDKPARDASLGLVYTSSGIINIREEEYARQFETILKNCPCPTCRQGLSRAYLHHLLAHTPLLAQRFLIQHNIFYVESLLSIGKLDLRKP